MIFLKYLSDNLVKLIPATAASDWISITKFIYLFELILNMHYLKTINKI